jgi:hydrogenase-4 component B
VTTLLVLAAILLAAASGLVALLCRRNRPGAERGFVGTMVASAIAGITGGVLSALGLGAPPRVLAWAVPGGAFELRLDAVAGIFLIQVFLIGALGAIYSVGYWPENRHPECTRGLRVFFGFMVAGMALLVTANNAVLFLVGWEVMALSAFMALASEHQKPEVREAGFVYLVATRLGTLAIIAMFALIHQSYGSFSLSVRNLDPTSGTGLAIFCLGFFGFGLKAGLMPLHVWLPGAHANAPTHVSALMSGVLIKMGIYGLIRLGSFYKAVPIGWGVTVFWLGAFSAVLGVVFALAQHDLKRLLAYHSVENIGIIVMGLGISLIGRALGRPELVALGLAGALLHTFNHGLFKSLLFLGAGSVITGVGTRNIDVLGGLSRKMPLTAIAFLVGAAAIAGLPPLNGFISELFVYVGMLKAGALAGGGLGILVLFGVPTLALVGALAVACFVKVYGMVFLGEPRTPACRDACESPRSMLLPMALLMLLCAAIGTMPVLVVSTLDRAITALGSGGPTARLSSLIPFRPLMLANLGLVVSIALGCALLWVWIPKRRAPEVPTWDCGYLDASPRMQYTASSFADGLVSLFSAVLRPRIHGPRLEGPFPKRGNFESHVPEVVLDLAVAPAVRWLGNTAAWFRWIQTGSLNLYVLYVLAALVVMLFVWR